MPLSPSYAGDEMAASRASIMALLHRLQNGLSHPPIEIVHLPHSRWPLPKSPPNRNTLQVMVLDASFNPPTLAHLSLANTLPSCSNKKEETETMYTNDIPHYDAKLLLLSVRNADKALKPGDATHMQRLHMMEIFSRHVTHHNNIQHSQELPNLAIAIIDEPTFVGKSSILQTFFKNWFAATPHNPHYDIQLNFMLGFDTLERLIQPRYYGSQEQMLTSLRKFLSPGPEGDNSRVICARRASSSFSATFGHSSESTELALVQEFIASGRISIIDIEEDVRSYSSSEVRDTIRRLGLESREWRKLVPNDVATYIIRENLYSTDPYPETM
ncbi:hypothetical protein H0H81_012413 [Sphagnurus paluster]|uniref:Nicotinamide-nucleotide adenylyltransferase n=1 Tax=Sphagnurus paluster TaxID=117069 RepID=A0A9P7FWJ0_9AGAR|nr:hypothetical protein H0H81_012413 [Sphagnurus paluster]